MNSKAHPSVFTNCEICGKGYLAEIKWPYVICKKCAEELNGIYERKKIDIEAAKRIQSHADKTDTNQDFKSRVQSAATKNEKELLEKKCDHCGNSFLVHCIENDKYLYTCIKCKLRFLKEAEESKKMCEECKTQYSKTGGLMYPCPDCIIRLNEAEQKLQTCQYDDDYYDDDNDY